MTRITTNSPAETIHSSMRHTASIACVSTHHFDKATAGLILAEEIEALMSYDHLSAEELREELGKKIEQYHATKAEAKKRFLTRGAKIDATIYTDAS